MPSAYLFTGEMNRISYIVCNRFIILFFLVIRCYFNFLFLFIIFISRFRCLLTTLQQKPDTVEKIVYACCVLHNFLLDKFPGKATNDVDREDPLTYQVIPGAWRQDVVNLVGLQPICGNTSLKTAKHNRRYLCKYYNSEAGKVPWQDKMI